MFFATIEWRGLGHILYPENFLPPDSFTVTADSINEPNVFEYFDYWQIMVPAEFRARVDTAWQVVNKLDITGQMSINDYSIGAYLYPPSVGLFNPDPAKWVFFLYQDLTRGPISIDNEETIPDGYMLYQNYPNPFNPITTIQYDLPEVSNVRLVIYDLLGREVITLIQDRQEAGYQSIIWNGRDRLGREVATGIYIYQLIAGDPSSGSRRTFVSTKKLVLIK